MICTVLQVYHLISIQHQVCIFFTFININTGAYFCKDEQLT